MACDCALPFEGSPGYFTLSRLFANEHPKDGAFPGFSSAQLSGDLL